MAEIADGKDRDNFLDDQEVYKETISNVSAYGGMKINKNWRIKVFADTVIPTVYF